MTHDEAAALGLPATCWHEAMGGDDWEAAPVIVEQHPLLQDEHKGLSQSLASAPHARQHALEATAQIKLQRWLDVFGHLSTDPDEVGNMWLALGDENDKMRSALQTLLDLGLLNVRASDPRAEAGARVAAQDALLQYHGAPSDNRNYLTTKS